MKNTVYTKDHEWLFINDNIVTVGITDFAQQQLGDAVYVELPEPGSEHKAGDEIAVIESVKAAGEIITPLDGIIEAVNEALLEDPDLLNQDPHGEGWFFKIKTPSSIDRHDFMTQEEYSDFIAEN